VLFKPLTSPRRGGIDLYNECKARGKKQYKTKRRNWNVETKDIPREQQLTTLRKRKNQPTSSETPTLVSGEGILNNKYIRKITPHQCQKESRV